LEGAILAVAFDPPPNKRLVIFLAGAKMVTPVPVKKELKVSHFAQIANSLAEVGRYLYSRGWVLGTSGNFSAVVTQTPFRLAITPSGVDKGALTPGQILQIDADGSVVEGQGIPSQEARLHLAIVRTRQAGAVLHTHSVWSTLLSEAYSERRGVGIEGYEMLKGLGGVATHQHQEWLPIIENSQDTASLGHLVENTLRVDSDAHGFLLRRHGLYTWGQDLAEAKRHVEILEFLLEVVGRRNEIEGRAAKARELNKP
jgi:methylthioribulose-1-phosphate dehydratase